LLWFVALNFVMNMMLLQSMFYIGCVAVACQNKSGLVLNYSWISA